MNDIDRQIRLSAIHVQWSESDHAFIARSDQYPDLAYHSESSLVALNGLVDTIHREVAAQTSAQLPPDGGRS